MTFSSLGLFLLVTSWVLPVVLIALAHGVRRGAPSADSEATTMSTALKGLRAEIGRPDLDAGKQAWRREDWKGPAKFVQAQITESPHEEMILTPYAEASVSVALAGGGRERRRCSLCLN